MNELTAFTFAENGTSWSTEAHFDTYELNAHYQLMNWRMQIHPLLLKQSGVYASIHEAALIDFPDMTLLQTTGTVFKSNLTMARWVKARFDNGTLKLLGALFKLQRKPVLSILV